MKFIIHGKNPLNGELSVSGAKNAALKIFPVALMTDGDIRVQNVPDIEDCVRAKELLVALGGEVREGEKGTCVIKRKKLECPDLPVTLVKKFRASIMFVGPMLAVCHRARFPHPGGCVIGAGTRDIDFFLDGFQKMGAALKITDDGFYELSAPKLKAIDYFFKVVSVTNTETFMTTACLAEGTTILKNCAMEPEIVALANFLNSCGAKIDGAGTPTIKIEGVEKLSGGDYRIIPDRIEAGTFAMLAAAVPGSDILIKNCDPSHLEALWAIFDEIGADYTLTKDTIRVRYKEGLKAHKMTTHEYPGFATDLQSSYTTLMTQAVGSCLIHETIYDRRLLFTDLLTQMGANIVMADPHRVVIAGPTKLRGRSIISPDLRAGMALVMAALMAEGKTEIDNIYQIDRGYEKIDERLNALGADIKREE